MGKVDLITGFLGVGKTTFIQNYITWLNKNNISFGIIENEFGAAGVDYSMLSVTNDNIYEISGGCICCTQKVSFAEALINFGNRFDRVIVEPSGIFTPLDFFELMETTNVKKICDYGFICAIVDPLTIGTYVDDELIMFQDQLKYADNIIFSKTQLINTEILERGKNNINVLIKNKTIYEKPFTEYTDIEYNTLIKTNYKKQEMKVKINDYCVINHANIFNSLVLYPENTYELSDLKLIIQELFSPQSGLIVRIKGFVKTNKQDVFLCINATKDNLHIYQVEKKIDVVLNIIGRNINRKYINSKIN